MILRNFLLTCLAILMVACGTESEQPKVVAEPEDKSVKMDEFKWVSEAVVTIDSCKNWGHHPTAFSIEVIDSFEVEYYPKEGYYLTLKLKDEHGAVTEELAFVQAEVDHPDGVQLYLAKIDSNLSTIGRKQGFRMNYITDFKGKAPLFGKEHQQLRTYASLIHKYSEYYGRYKFLTYYPFPESHPELAGVKITTTTRTTQAFDPELLMSRRLYAMLSTFKFLEVIDE